MAAQLTQGQVDRLAVDDVVVSVYCTAPVDVSAILLTASGRARDERDLVFYNSPDAGAVRLIAGEPSVEIELRSLPPEIEHVRVIATLVDGQAGFGGSPPSVQVADTAGNVLYEYAVDGLGIESAVVALDLDRLRGGWQLRMLGEGYPAGFGALVTAHGVPVGPGPDDWVYRGPAVLDPGQHVALQEIRQGDLALVKLGLGWDPIRVHGPRGPREVQIDLDASALLFVGRDLVDVAFYQQLSSRDGSVRHSGDNLTGDGKGDDEVISVDLARIPRPITAVVFVITSYAGHTFERVRNSFWRLIDGATNVEMARGNLRAGGTHTGMVVAKVSREQGGWRLSAIGAPIEAGHPVEAVAQVAPYL